MSRGAIGMTLLVTIVFIVAGLLAVIVFSPSGSTDKEISSAELHEVRMGSFDITVPVRGDLNSASQIDIRNKLEDRASIIFIAPEGNTVKKGDLLLKLADEQITARVKDSQDKVKTSESSLISSQQSVNIKKSAMESDLEKAELDIELARLALLAWEQGDLVSKRQTHEIAIQTAEINLNRLQDRFEDTKSLLEKGFIPKDEYEQDRIKLIEAEAKLKEVRLAKEVYESYQIKQDQARLESGVEQNIAEQARIKQRHEAELVKLKSDVASAEFKLQTAKERLEDLERQLEACTIISPSSGLVVYASSLNGRGRRDDDPPPQIGSELRPNELVIVLPNTGEMMARVKVGESISGKIKSNQEAIIVSDALPDTTIRGSVDRVGVLAESGGWRDPNNRTYTVYISLDIDEGTVLKPSMRCSGEIIVGTVEDVFAIPIQAVYREGSVSYVYLDTPNGFVPTPVSLGQSSEMEVEITDGLSAGDVVLLRKPSASEIQGELPKNSGSRSGAPSKYTGGTKSGRPS